MDIKAKQYQPLVIKFNTRYSLEVVSYHTGWENTCECCNKESNISTECFIKADSFYVEPVDSSCHLNLCHVCFATFFFKIVPSVHVEAGDLPIEIKDQILTYMRKR